MASAAWFAYVTTTVPVASVAAADRLDAQTPAAQVERDPRWASRGVLPLRTSATACRMDEKLVRAAELAAVPGAQARFLAVPANGCTELPRELRVTVRRVVRSRAAVDVSPAAARAAGSSPLAGSWWVPLAAIPDR